MNLTVAICSWNRASLLDQTLTEMRKLRIPSGVDWELLVVNNNSTDTTDAVIARHSAALPLRRLFEPKQGQSNARNCAIDAAKGDFLIWTDDDVLVDENWLAEYVRAAEAWPQASIFGGRIDTWYECEPPHSFRKYEDGLLPVRSLGSDERPLSESEYVYGANMAFRVPAIKNYPFDTTLGRVGDEFVLGDELCLIRRMRRDGHSGVWVPSAVVKHFVPVSRTDRRNIWKYVCGSARMSVRMKDITPMGRTFLRAPRWLYPEYVKAILNYWWQSAMLREVPFPAFARRHGFRVSLQNAAIRAVWKQPEKSQTD